MDLFLAAGEMSGDLHGSKLIAELLTKRPNLKIGAVAGPKMRTFPIQTFFPMESLRVMGFIDVFFALPKLIRQFFAIRNQILALNPQAVVCIDYPEFHLRLASSLRKKGYKGKLIHMVCPTVWAWRKGRISQMAETLDLLLTLFPFEKKCFAHTKLPVHYIGHPLVLPIASFTPSTRYQGQKILGIFPGSRQAEIARNLPIQLVIAKKLQQLDPSLRIEISNATDPVEKNYDLMKASHLAIATSGTVTLELALHGTPTVVNFAIRPLDRFIAQKIFRIHLPFYCLANIVANQSVFPELFGPHLTEEQLLFWAQKLWFDNAARERCLEGCANVRKSLEMNRPSPSAAEAIFSLLAF
jgi:lipid-A-disaccharide synthase